MPTFFHFSRLSRSFRLFLFALSALVVFWSPRAAMAAPAFPLHTQGQWIVDSNGTRVHLNAFNWYGAEGTDFVVEGLEAQPLTSIVSAIKGLGFNAVRLLWSNQMVETNPVVGSYALTANPSLEGENALTIFDTVVNALTNAGIMVILDNHMSNAGWCCSTTDNNELWYNTQYPQTSWVADWQTMAQRYASNPWVIGADLRNEPRSPATWGGSASTDWHAAAELGGNAVLGVNPNMLIFVEGVSYAGDLSGVASLPVVLNVANQLVYEAHDYGFWYSGFSSYASYVNTITPKWGYLVTGANPQPVWIGEFGTCNSANTCVNSSNESDLGNWFNAMTSYVETNGLDWSYWAINGTTESGNGGGFGTVEGYGVLDTSWNASALPLLTARLQSMMATSAGINLVSNAGPVTLMPGAVGSATVTIVPAGGFSGTVSLSCAITGPTGAVAPPQCSVPASQSSVTVSGNAPVVASVSIATTGAVARNAPGGPLRRGDSGRIAGLALTGVLLVFAGRRRSGVLLMLVMLAGTFAIAACGSGGSASTASTTATSAGSYTVTVTASASGLQPVSAQIGLTIQ
jgi:endoglucanase